MDAEGMHVYCGGLMTSEQTSIGKFWREIVRENTDT
jgi:hypothetical protein